MKISCIVFNTATGNVPHYSLLLGLTILLLLADDVEGWSLTEDGAEQLLAPSQASSVNLTRHPGLDPDNTRVPLLHSVLRVSAWGSACLQF